MSIHYCTRFLFSTFLVMQVAELLAAGPDQLSRQSNLDKVVAGYSSLLFTLSCASALPTVVNLLDGCSTYPRVISYPIAGISGIGAGISGVGVGYGLASFYHVFRFSSGRFVTCDVGCQPGQTISKKDRSIERIIASVLTGGWVCDFICTPDAVKKQVFDELTSQLPYNEELLKRGFNGAASLLKAGVECFTETPVRSDHIDAALVTLAVPFGIWGIKKSLVACMGWLKEKYDIYTHHEQKKIIDAQRQKINYLTDIISYKDDQKKIIDAQRQKINYLTDIISYKDDQISDKDDQISDKDDQIRKKDCEINFWKNEWNLLSKDLVKKGLTNSEFGNNTKLNELIKEIDQLIGDVEEYIKDIRFLYEIKY